MLWRGLAMHGEQSLRHQLRGPRETGLEPQNVYNIYIYIYIYIYCLHRRREQRFRKPPPHRCASLSAGSR